MSGRKPDRNRFIPRIALTGGIASGKSTVAKLFTTLGARLIDTDQTSREIVTPPSLVLDRIADRFGPQVLKPDGTLNRAHLRTLVFQDQQARLDLESITHPAIRAEVARQSARAGGPYQLIAIPLLVETGTASDYDRVLVVDAAADMQVRRLMLRDGITREAAERMLSAQVSRDQRRAIAHDVIDNDGDLTHLVPQVEALHRVYLALQPA
ncbi:MAG: dephospho-CoA kinase [Burkholderiaceae bacterium]